MEVDCTEPDTGHCARNVSLTRESFRGFRIGGVVIYFDGDKVGDVSIGE